MVRLNIYTSIILLLLTTGCASKKGYIIEKKINQRVHFANQGNRTRVLLDEANFNSYIPELKPFLDLLTANEYLINNKKKRFTRESLNNYDILVIIGPLRTDIHNSVVFSPNGNTLAFGSSNHTIQLWNVKTGKPQIVLKNSDWVGSVAFSPDGKNLAASSADMTVKLWDLHKGLVKITINGGKDTVRSVIFSHNGQTLALGGDNHNIELYDVNTGHLRLILKGHKSNVYSIAFSPDNKILASGGGDETIKLWDAISGQLRTSLKGKNGKIRSVVFSPNGQILASSGDGQNIQLWDIKTGQEQKVLNGLNGPVYLAFSPNGKTIASGCSDGTIKLWNIETGEILDTLVGHTDEIWSVAFSPDGKTLASIDYDEEIKLWDVDSGKVLHTLTGRENFIWNPGTAFTKEECNAVKDWVYNGGRLLLATDHAPYGATSANLARQFGVKVSNSNGTVDPFHHDISPAPRIFTGNGNEGWLTFTRTDGLLIDHPITLGNNVTERVNRIITYYGNSLEGPNGSTSFLTLSSSAIDLFSNGVELSSSGRSQGIALHFGKGRVVVLGEMGMLMVLNRLDYDNKQLALNIMRWLSGSLN